MNRAAKKRQTRERILNSAMAMVDEGRHYSQIAIREIARSVEVTPNAFYRHFENLDALWSSAIKEIAQLLSAVLQEYPKFKQHDGLLFESVIILFVEHFKNNPSHLKLIGQMRISANKNLRTDAELSVNQFVSELTNAMQQVMTKHDTSKVDLMNIAEMVTIYGLDICLQEAFREKPDWKNVSQKLNHQLILLLNL